MNSILFLAVLFASSCSLSFTQSQEPQEPFVDDDDARDAAPKFDNGKFNSAAEPKYPDGVNTIPGDAEKDYPTYDAIWKTSFSCSKRPPGFYADVEARCQIWHNCDTRGHQQSFLCSNGTIFSQKNRVCEWWYNVNCDLNEVEANYQVNDDLYQIPESASHWQEDNERRENEERKDFKSNPVEKNQPKSQNFNYREKDEPQPSQYRESTKPQQQQQQNQYREPARQQQQQQQQNRGSPKPQPQPGFNYKDNTQVHRNEVEAANPKPRQSPLVPVTHVINREQIREILLNGGADENSHLSDDERYPLKAKLRMQREREVERLRKLEEAKQAKAKEDEPKPLPVRVVKFDNPFNQNQQTTKPAIIRLSNTFGVNPPKSTPQSFRQPQQQFSTTQAPVYRPTTTTTTYVPRTYATQRTPAPAPVWATTTTRPTTTTRRPTQPPPPPPPPATPSDYNRPRPQDNYVRPVPREEQGRNKFEDTDESKFPQQQARAFPSFNSATRPRIEDPVNSEIQDQRVNRYQQQQERRFQGDVNADGNRFQNGETRRGGGANQQQQQQQRSTTTAPPPPQPQQDRRPAQNQNANNRFNNREEEPERPRPQSVDRGQPAPRPQPQQQQQPQRNFRQQEENVRPQQQQPEQRRPTRPINDDPPARRPFQEEERANPAPQPQRKPTPEPEPRNQNAVRDFQGKPEPQVFAGPQFAAPESNRHKFRHSTPRQHNVRFATPSRRDRDRDAEESQVSEESQQHPVPSVYNHRYVHPQQFQQQQRQAVRENRPEPVVEEKIYTTTTRAPTRRPEPVRTAATEPTTIRPREFSRGPQPTPRAETAFPVVQGGGIKNPTIVRIIVKQRPKNENQRQESERRRGEEDDESLDVREEEEFFHREAERGFGGRHRS